MILTRNAACQRFSLVPSLPFPLTLTLTLTHKRVIWYLLTDHRFVMCLPKFTCEPLGTSLKEGVNIPFSVGPSAWPTLKEVVNTRVMILIPLYT